MEKNRGSILNLTRRLGNQTLEKLKLDHTASRAKSFLQASSTVLRWAGTDRAQAYGFFIPYARVDELKPLSEDIALSWLSEKLKSVDATALTDLMSNWNQLYEQWTIPDPDRHAPYLLQDQVSGLDASAIYSFTYQAHPKKIVQIGSGQTTRLLAQAVRDCGSKTEISVIDENADRTIDSLVTRVTRARFEDVEVQEWMKLTAGDILVCDTTHIFFPGTDVDKLLTEVLPQLASGVLICWMKAYLPFGYPRSERTPGWNAASALAAMLGGGERYQFIFSAAHARRTWDPRILTKLSVPIHEGYREGSLWLKVQ